MWRPMPDTTAWISSARSWLTDPTLGSRAFNEPWPELADDPSEDDIRSRLRNLARSNAWAEQDVAVILISGHGTLQGDDHYLVLRETDSTKLASSSIRVADILGWLAETPIEHLLVILDAGLAESVLAAPQLFNVDPDRDWIIIPTVMGPDSVAVEGALGRALSEFSTGLRTPEGRRYGEGPYIEVADFLTDLQNILPPDQRLDAVGGGDRANVRVCLPNPHYRGSDEGTLAPQRLALALPLSDLETHWGPRARGVVNEDEAGWLFSGRRDLLRALISTATGPARTTIVTGGAGSGKSAVLARLVTLSDADFMSANADQFANMSGDQFPPLGAVDAAALATGKLPGQVMSHLCQTLAVPLEKSGPAEATIEEMLTAWHSWLGAREGPVTLVIDALDEATDAHALLRDVLSRLEGDGTHPRLRLILGVRSSAASTETATQLTSASEASSLVDAAEVALGAVRISVDQSPWWDPNDVVTYVERILTRTPNSPYESAGGDLVGQIARAVAQRAGRSFLFARIAASSLTNREELVSVEDRDWLAGLDQGVLGVFREDLHRSIPDPDDRRRAVVLLRAVAYAKGAGLPWRGIWPLVADAVDDEGRRYGDTDVAWLLESRLGAYLIADRDGGTTVYRLFHELLRTTLRDRWQELLRTWSP